jgi:pimeloyl-ACP methyl ester carboxylesterase
MVAIPAPGPYVTVPTLGVSGVHDPFMLSERVEASGRFVTGPWRFERFEDAGHWLPLERPERLNRLLVEFLKDRSP